MNRTLELQVAYLSGYSSNDSSRVLWYAELLYLHTNFSKYLESHECFNFVFLASNTVIKEIIDTVSEYFSNYSMSFEDELDDRTSPFTAVSNVVSRGTSTHWYLVLDIISF